MRGVKLRVWLKACVGRAFSAALIEIDLAADPPPALTKHPICGELRTGKKGGAQAAAVAGEGQFSQHIAERIIVEVDFLKNIAVILLHDPITVVKG